MISDLDDVVPRPTLLMTRLQTEPQHMAELLQLAEDSAPVFTRQPGFLGGEAFRSSDDTCLVSLLRWRREADHLACRESPDFGELNDRFQRLLDSGQARFDAHVLVRVGTFEPYQRQSATSLEP